MGRAKEVFKSKKTKDYARSVCGKKIRYWSWIAVDRCVDCSLIVRQSAVSLFQPMNAQVEKSSIM